MILSYQKRKRLLWTLLKQKMKEMNEVGSNVDSKAVAKISEEIHCQEREMNKLTMPRQHIEQKIFSF
jgi:hypothetical protein